MISASKLREASQNVRAAQEAEQEQRKAEYEAKAERRAEELTDYVESHFPDQEEALARATGDWTLPNGRKARPVFGMRVFGAHPPIKGRGFEPEEVYFSSYNKETGELGPSGPGSGAVPMVMLLQGRKPPGAAQPDPTDAPGGRNVVMRLQDRLAAQAKEAGDGDEEIEPPQIRTIWSRAKCMFQICLVWDPEGWDKQQQERRDNPRPRRDDRRGGRRDYEPRAYNQAPPPPDMETISYAEYERQQQARAAALRDQFAHQQKAPSDGLGPAPNPGMRLMEKMGHKDGEGLGRHGQGRREPVQAELHPRRQGLGFNTDAE